MAKRHTVSVSPEDMQTLGVQSEDEIYDKILGIMRCYKGPMCSGENLDKVDRLIGKNCLVHIDGEVKSVEDMQAFYSDRLEHVKNQEGHPAAEFLPGIVSELGKLNRGEEVKMCVIKNDDIRFLLFLNRDLNSLYAWKIDG